MEHLVNHVVDLIVMVAGNFLLPVVFTAYIAGIVLRVLIFFTVKREEYFLKEFEKRTVRFIEKDEHKHPLSFYAMVKRLLEKTYYECFEVRGLMKRRRLDHVMVPSDRLFLIQQGCAFFVRDTLKQIRFLKTTHGRPKFIDVSKTVLQNNPSFNKLMGILPLSPFNDLSNMLPGLFIIGGIFGTFLGIMKALPGLGNMNLNDVEGTKMVMDTFLLKVSFSMGASVVGISLSVTLSIFNNFLSAERVYAQNVERYDILLGNLWDLADNNNVSKHEVAFDEHKDPIEALAEMAVAKELDSKSARALERESAHDHVDEGQKKAS